MVIEVKRCLPIWLSELCFGKSEIILKLITLIICIYSTLRLTSFLGISTLELTMKNHFHGEVYPFSNSHYDTKAQVDNYLDLNQAAAMAQFMIVLILKLVMSPKLPFSVVDYGRDVEAGIQHFMGKKTL